MKFYIIFRKHLELNHKMNIVFYKKTSVIKKCFKQPILQKYAYQ